MEAFAVFEGGGVKGAALAGALAAAAESKIKFVGYGGASAGSIVALLATVGYSPKELLGVLLKYRLTDFLDDKSGAKLENTKNWVQSFFESKYKSWALTTSPLFYSFFSKNLRESRKLFNDLCDKKGVYSTKNLELILLELVEAKLPSLFSNEKCKPYFSFKDLYLATGVELKVIASDVNNGRAIIFSNDEATKDSCVISAVCASSSYPLVFQPNHQLHSSSVLVDGGLSSNLPAFLFNDKNHKKLPIYAFDLYKNEDVILRKSKDSKIHEFTWSLISTALEASDNIMSNLVEATPIKVKVPESVNTLDFEIKRASILEMFESGKYSASESFKLDPITVKAALAGSDSTKLARALYGTELYLPLLNSVMDLSYDDDEGTEIRSWLYASVENDDSKIVSFCWAGKKNFEGFKNEYIFTSNSNSDAFECWNAKRVVIASATNNGNDITRLCLPIFKKQDAGIVLNDICTMKNNQIVGVLVLEINSPKEICFWLTEQGDDISTEYSEIVRLWLAIISKVMVSKET